MRQSKGKIGLRAIAGSRFFFFLYKLFLFFISFVLFLSYDKERVTVRAELIVSLKGKLVRLHHVFIPSESRD